MTDKIDNIMKELYDSIFSVSSKDFERMRDVVGPLMFYQAFNDHKDGSITADDIQQIEATIIETRITSMDAVINVTRLLSERAAMKMIMEIDG